MKVVNKTGKKANIPFWNIPKIDELFSNFNSSKIEKRTNDKFNIGIALHELLIFLFKE